MLNKALYTFEDGKIKVYGNNHDIPLVYWYELTEKEKKEFNYLDSEDKQDNFTGFRYKGNTYDLGEFMNIHNSFYNPNSPNWMKNFDGYHGDSFFSGILVKYNEERDNEFVKVYTYIS